MIHITYVCIMKLRIPLQPITVNLMEKILKSKDNGLNLATLQVHESKIEMSVSINV